MVKHEGFVPLQLPSFVINWRGIGENLQGYCISGATSCSGGDANKLFLRPTLMRT